MTDIDQVALNSATKYPSIPTYHALDPQNGRLLEEVVRFEGQVVLTEKVNGANGRIIILPDGDWYIGSREELLYARGDRIVNPALGIVPALFPLASRLWERTRGEVSPVVFYLEVYGHRIGGGWKNYTTGTHVGFRLFDLARIPVEVLGQTPEQIAGWRERDGQLFAGEDVLLQVSVRFGIPLVPRLGTLPGDELPQGLEETQTFLTERLNLTRAALDASGQGAAEGIVFRSADRKTIAKARFQSYTRTLQSPQERKKKG